MMTDLTWWLHKLDEKGITHTLHPCNPLQDLGLFANTSTSWGIGIIIRDHWASFQLSPIWKVASRNICWLKTVAVELLTYFLEEMGLQHCWLLIHTDNQGTIAVPPTVCPMDSDRLSSDPAISDGPSRQSVGSLSESVGIHQNWLNSAASPGKVQWKSAQTT